MYRRFFGIFALCLATLAFIGGPALSQGGGLVIELNKFEDGEQNACQAFFLFRNSTDETFESFEMSFAILDGNGVIDRLLTIDASPLNASRTALKLFELPDISCADVSEILIHEIGSCKPQNQAEIDCFPLIDLVSRTDAKLVF